MVPSLTQEFYLLGWIGTKQDGWPFLLFLVPWWHSMHMSSLSVCRLMVWDSSCLVSGCLHVPKSCFCIFLHDKNKQKQWWSWSSKHAFALFSDFFWRGPRALWSKSVDLWKLYLLVHLASQDQAWLLKNALPPPSNLQTQKWKVAVFWLIDGIVWWLWNGSDRA